MPAATTKLPVPLDISRPAPRSVVARRDARRPRVLRRARLSGGVTVLAIMAAVGLFLSVEAVEALRKTGVSFLTTAAWQPDRGEFGIAAVLTGDGADRARRRGHRPADVARHRPVHHPGAARTRSGRRSSPSSTSWPRSRASSTGSGACSSSRAWPSAWPAGCPPGCRGSRCSRSTGADPGSPLGQRDRLHRLDVHRRRGRVPDGHADPVLDHARGLLAGAGRRAGGGVRPRRHPLGDDPGRRPSRSRGAGSSAGRCSGSVGRWARRSPSS